MELETCGICKAEFRKGNLENGKCSKCTELWPNAMSSDDRREKNETEKENESRMNNVIKKQVHEMLVEYGFNVEVMNG